MGSNPTWPSIDLMIEDPFAGVFFGWYDESMETLSNNPEEATDKPQKLADELKAMIPQEKEMESSRIETILQQFGSEQHAMASVGGIEVIGLGNIEQMEALASAAKAALDRLQDQFGGQLEAAFPGLKIYFADGAIDTGGEALADENAIIMDASKAAMSVGDVEALLVEMGFLNPGDWTSKVSPDLSYGEITIVHEMGHMLEARAYGTEGVGFVSLSSETAVTKYGSKAPNEDYAEAFFYNAYGLDVGSDRKAILERDISSVTLAAAA